MSQHNKTLKMYLSFNKLLIWVLILRQSVDLGSKTSVQTCLTVFNWKKKGNNIKCPPIENWLNKVWNIAQPMKIMV